MKTNQIQHIPKVLPQQKEFLNSAVSKLKTVSIRDAIQELCKVRRTESYHYIKKLENLSSWSIYITINHLLENKVLGRIPRKELSQVYGQHFE